MEKLILTENDNGMIFRYKKIPNSMFNFYMLKKKTYKNGKSLWHLCVEVANAPSGKKSPACVQLSSNYIKLQSFVGTSSQAIKKLDEIIISYN